MRNSILIALLFLGLSCSDGDLQIETLDFDSVTAQNCEELTSKTEIFFKINGDEALILDLAAGDLENGNSRTDTVSTNSTIPSQSKLIYRIFSENVTNTYFCDDFPPASPNVIEEIEAQEGTVIIKSIANADSTAFNHVVQLSGITLINSSGERITDLSINDFAELTIPISN